MSVVLLDTTDLAEAEDVLSANYTKMRLSAPADALTRTRVTRSYIGSAMTVDEIEYNYDLTFDSDPLDHIVLCRVRSGGFKRRFGDGDVEMLGPSTVTAVGALDGIPHSGQAFQAHCDAVTIDRGLLSSVAANPPQRDSDGATVELTACTPISLSANKQLVHAIDHVRHSIVSNPAAVQHPLVARGVAQYLASTVLAAYPSTALLEPTVVDRRDTTSALLRRAIAFIDDNAHRDISITDIANHVYVSPRAVQLMFRTHRDCTPMQYLRTVRLHHAHLDLLVSDCLSTTVLEIAHRWGFGHLGRFAVFYRQHYGQSPYATLRS